MRKVSIYLLALMLVVLFSGCGSNQDDKISNVTKNKASGQQSKDTTDKKDNHNESDKKKAELPDIPKQAIEHAYDVLSDYEMVKDPYIEVSKKKNLITFAIQVNAATSKEHAKELGDNFVRALASGVSIYSEKDLKSPGHKNLGEIYDYYDIQIGIGSGPDNFIVRGEKVTSASKITW